MEKTAKSQAAKGQAKSPNNDTKHHFVSEFFTLACQTSHRASLKKIPILLNLNNLIPIDAIQAWTMLNVKKRKSAKQIIGHNLV